MQIQFPFCHHGTKGLAPAHEDDLGVRESLGGAVALSPFLTGDDVLAVLLAEPPKPRRGTSENPCGSPGVSDPSPHGEKASAGVSAVVP